MLQIKHLSKSFGGVHAMQDVSFTVREGAVHSVIGPNGAGKTTLFNLISGIYVPSAGEIVLDVITDDGNATSARTQQVIAAASAAVMEERIGESGLSAADVQVVFSAPEISVMPPKKGSRISQAGVSPRTGCSRIRR